MVLTRVRHAAASGLLLTLAVCTLLVSGGCTSEKGQDEIKADVKENTDYPRMSVGAESIRIPLEQEYTLEPVMEYAGRRVIATYAFFSDGDCVSLKGGTLRGVKEGTCIITVKGYYAEELLEQTVRVEVVAGDYFYAAEREITLYSSDLFGQGLVTEYTVFSYSSTTASPVLTSSDPQVAAVDGSVIKGVSAGTATVTLAQGEKKDQIQVTVLKPQARVSAVADLERANAVSVISMGEYAAYFAGLTSEDLHVTQGERAIAVKGFSGGKLSVSSGDIDLGPQTLLVTTDRFILEYPVVMATMIVDNADEFMQIKQKYYQGGELAPFGETPDKYRDGYFILNTDIDMGGRVFAVDPRNVNTEIWQNGGETSYRGQVGWYGVLDGRGHVVRNIVSGQRGFFGNLEKESVIKNVAFVGSQADAGGTAYGSCGLLADVIVGKVDNVLVVLDRIPVADVKTGKELGGKAGICKRLYGEISNSVVVITSGQKLTGKGANPAVIVNSIQGNPVDSVPKGCLTNTYGLSSGNLLAVISETAEKANEKYAGNVSHSFAELKTAVKRGFSEDWRFGDDFLSFGSCVVKTIQ